MVINHSDFPFTPHNFQHKDFTFHYLDEGSGEPILLLHGNPTWSYYYRNLILALRSEYRLLAFDQLGCGRSQKPVASQYPFTLAARIDDFSAWVDHVMPGKKITIMLHDWGGAVGMGYAIRNPQRIARILLSNTAAFRMPEKAKLHYSLKLFRTPLGALLMQGLNLFAQGTVRNCTYKRSLTAAERANYLSPYDSWGNRLAITRFVQDIPLNAGHPSYSTLLEIEEGLPRLKNHPMLILWGMRDFIFTPPFLDCWQRHFPEAAIERFDEGGHLLLDDCIEEMLPTIRSFLRSHPYLESVHGL